MLTLLSLKALTPYLEARSFDVDKFFSVLHSVGSVAAVLVYMQMADRFAVYAYKKLLSPLIHPLSLEKMELNLSIKINVCLHRLDYFTRVAVDPHFILCGLFLLVIVILSCLTVKDNGKVILPPLSMKYIHEHLLFAPILTGGGAIRGSVQRMAWLDGDIVNIGPLLWS